MIRSPDPAGAPEVAIATTLPCPAWRSACAAAPALAEDAARLALSLGLRREFAARTVVVDIRLSDDAEQRRLNRRYRGRDTSTNVLAFPAAEPGESLPLDAPLLLGDVVLAFETVEREATEQHKPLADHLCHLVVHGTLHLLGYDHQTRCEAAAMEALEREILAVLGVPDPYRDIM